MGGGRREEGGGWKEVGGKREGQEDIPQPSKARPRTQWGEYLGKCQVMEGACGLWSPARSPRGHTSFSPALFHIFFWFIYVFSSSVIVFLSFIFCYLSAIFLFQIFFSF